MSNNWYLASKFSTQNKNSICFIFISIEVVISVQKLNLVFKLYWWQNGTRLIWEGYDVRGCLSAEKIQFFAFEAFLRNVLHGLKRLINLLTVSSILIALTGFFQTLGGYILLDVPVNYSICFAVFLLTFSIYSANKLTDMKEGCHKQAGQGRIPGGKRGYNFVPFNIFVYYIRTDNVYKWSDGSFHPVHSFCCQLRLQH